MIIEDFDINSERHRSYANRMPLCLTEDTAGLVACTANLAVMGAILFYGFYPNSAVACYQIDNPLCLRKPGLLTEAGRIAFEVWELKMIFCSIEEDNFKSQNLAKKIGWKKFAYAPHAAEDHVGLVFYQMLDKDYRNSGFCLNEEAA